MCTVTWRRSPDGYQVFFNRDEKRDREPALPPALHVCNGVRYLAALDGRAGGTWLAVNEHGVGIGMLNHYQAGPAAPPGRLSRGLLVTSLMDVPEATAVGDRLPMDILRDYAPFRLLVWAPGQPVQWHQWDGSRRTASVLRDDEMPVTTSSFESDEVVAARRALWDRLLKQWPAPSELFHAEYHRSTDPRGGAYSVFMTRPDAMTVSYSRIRVTEDTATFYYAARSPDDPILPLGQSLVMIRE